MCGTDASAPFRREALLLQSCHNIACFFPDDPGYQRTLQSLFSAFSLREPPQCVFCPSSTAEVAAIMRLCRQHHQSVTVRGGGLSPICSANSAVLIDLQPRLAGVHQREGLISAGGGVRMGALLARLTPQGETIPVGVSMLPGLGLATQGGIGYLTRRFGLTLDHIVEMEFVTPTGDIYLLNDKSQGLAGELWWGVRGAAPNLGVVTQVTFRPRPLPDPLVAIRLVMEAEAILPYFELAPALPRGLSASAVLGYPGGKTGPLRSMIYWVGGGDAMSPIELLESTVQQFLDQSGVRPLQHLTKTCDAMNLPNLELPGESEPMMPPLPSELDEADRLYAFKKGRFVRSLAACGAELVRAVHDAPGPMCRIDFQHAGGALRDVDPQATAFWNRDFEWSCPIIGAWRGSASSDCQRTRDWVRAAAAIMDSDCTGTYAVDMIPGIPEAERETELAFGGHRDRLRQLKSTVDPEGLLRHYYPL